MPKCDKKCKKTGCIFFRKTVIPSVAGNDDIAPPENGDFCNMLVVYEATGNAYLFASDGIPTLLSTTDYTRLSNLPSINGVTIVDDVTLEELGITQLVSDESNERKVADSILQEQIDAIAISSGVVDVVGTYEELEEYDTSKLKGGEIVKVLADETIGGSTAYYRWENGAWNYIGEEGPYYTKNETDALLDQKLDVDAFDDALENYYDKAETDALLADKADAADLVDKQDKLIAGNNITIDQATNVISATVPSLDNYYTKQETYSKSEVDGIVSGVEEDIPTATSQLTNDSGFLTNIPTASASTLGAIKVGSGLSITQDGTLSADTQNIDVDTALSTTSANPVENRVITSALNGKANTSDIPTVPSNVSAFYNDAGYITNATLAQNYYNKTETYTKTEVDGLIPTVNNATLTIQRNGTSIGTFTANASSNKTVNIAVPTATSDLTNDSGFLTGTDYATASTGGVVKVGGGLEITNGVLSATGGGTADAVEWANVLNKPTNVSYWANDAGYITSSDLPTVGNATLTIQKNGTAVDTFTANATSNKTINITVPTTAAEVSALPDSTKYGASISVSLNTTDYKMTTTLKDQDGNTLGAAQTVDLPLESVVVNGSYDNTNKKIVLTLQNGNTVDIPVGDLIAGLQTEITSTNKLSSDLVDDTNHTHKFVTAAQITKLNGIATGAEVNVQSDWDVTDTTSDAFIKNKPTIPTVNNATLTIQKNGTNVQTFTANQSTNATANIVTDELQRKSDTRSSMKPSDANYPAKATLHFSTIGAFDTQTQSGGYADALLLNSWNNDSGGRVNALVATKQNDQKLYHYTGMFNGSTWSGKKEIAYVDSLATVATSGSYNDLSNKPTIPTVNNATLTIQKNGSTVNTFTANASSNVTANITVPTQTSELTNNSGFLTSSTGVTSVNGNTGAVTGIQTTGNLVTSVSSSSTNSQYPSAKLFYDTVGNVESVLQTLNSGTGV